MILVTGGTGLIGGHLLYRFRESATSIRAMYRTRDSINKTKDIFEYYKKGSSSIVDSFEWVEADLTDLPSLEKIFKDVTQVYHCAAVIDSKFSFKEIKMVNVRGTSHIVNLSIVNKVKKLCYVSSIAALGDSIKSAPINEEDFFNIESKNSDYAISKYGGEMEVWRGTQEGLSAIIVLPGLILGEGNWHSGSGQIFSKTSQGNSYYTNASTGFVDVQDVVQIMQLLMDSEIVNQRYLLVSENKPVKEVLCSIADILNVKKPSVLLKKWMLVMVSWFSSIYSFLGGIDFLKYENALVLASKSSYDNHKISKELDYKFIAVDDSITRIATQYKQG